MERERGWERKRKRRGGGVEDREGEREGKKRKRERGGGAETDGISHQ